MKLKINWNIRKTNKTFWVAIASSTALFIGNILQAFGIDVDTSSLTTVATVLAGGVFYIVTLIGTTNDPTTPGVSDSERVLNKAKTTTNESELGK